MCGGFPCNCCKPRLSIDTDFDNDKPWKCFFRNTKITFGTLGYTSTTFGDFSRRQAATRPILDWPCTASKLAIPANTTGSVDPLLMVTMKHPFDVSEGDSFYDYSYAIELEFEPVSELNFHSLVVTVGEEIEAAQSYYGISGSTILDTAREHFRIDLFPESSDSFDDYPPGSFVVYNGTRISFSVPNTTSTKNDRNWRSKLMTDAVFSLSAPHTLRLEWSRLSDRYTVDVFVDGTRRTMRCVNAGSGTAGFGGTSPTTFQDTIQTEIRSPRSNGLADPLPWKNYRVGFRSYCKNSITPFAQTRDPLLYDRLAITNV
jgi:hypothetical protein